MANQIIYCSEEQFSNLGNTFMKKKKGINEREFRKLFGIKPLVCAVIWKLLNKTKWFHKKIIKDPQPMHLLHTLRFLKSYGVEEVHAMEAEVTCKTWRKWCWLYVEGIAGLAKHVVSLLS